MYEYRIDKKIEDLDPIPDSWSDEQRKLFIDEGYIPMAGKVPQSGIVTDEYKTKKVTADDIYGIVTTKISAMMLDSETPRTTDGTFALHKIRSSGPELVISGSNIKLPPGWYHYDARVNFGFDGVTPLNKCEPITVESSIHSNTQKSAINFDFSYSHTEQIVLSDIIYNDGSSQDGHLDFNLSISGIGASGATGVSATLVLNIQTVPALG